MSSKNVYEKFKELNKNNVITCTEQDLQEFIMYGLILQTGEDYVTRDNKKLNVDLIKNKELKFNLNFQNLIQVSNKIYKQQGIKKVYFMSSRCYNMYKQQGLIINKDNKEYYRLFDKELCLVYIL